MQFIHGIGLTDEVNKKNEVIPIDVMTKSYFDRYEDKLPMLLKHDHSKVLGWNSSSGIFCDSEKSYYLLTSVLAETKDEHDYARGLHEKEINQNLLLQEQDYLKLEKKLEGKLSEKSKKCWRNAVSYSDHEIVVKAIPRIKDLLDKKGLIDLKELEIVQPGIFKFDDFLLFAHKGFRRGFSRMNSFNEEFLKFYQTINTGDNTMKIAIDLDLIGLSGSDKKELEYDYWYGPMFDDQLEKIRFGVTRHENLSGAYSNVNSTEFGWYEQDGRRTFECEELINTPNIDSVKYGCRFVHSMIDPKTNLPYHIDGAIRAYTEEKMIDRMSVNMSKAGRDTEYTKLWRIDGVISVKDWKSLINFFYRENNLVLEYLEGNDESSLQNNPISSNMSETRANNLNNYIPYDFSLNNGICFALKAFPHNNNANIREKSVIFIAEDQSYYESESIEVIKLLFRKGISVNSIELPILKFCDSIINFPIIMCADVKTANIVLETILDICKVWKEKGVNKAITFTIRINYLEKQLSYSFSGGIDEIVVFFSEVKLPKYDSILKWMADIRNIMKGRFSQNNNLNPWDIFKENGQLYLERVYINESKIDFEINDYGVKYKLKEVAKKEKDLLENGSLSVGLVYEIKNSECSSCKGVYKDCLCIKLIDEEIIERIVSSSILGAFWTDPSFM